MFPAKKKYNSGITILQLYSEELRAKVWGYLHRANKLKVERTPSSVRDKSNEGRFYAGKYKAYQQDERAFFGICDHRGGFANESRSGRSSLMECYP